jgi:hypothetical protein
MESPRAAIACRLEALTPGERLRSSEIRRHLQSATERVEETPTGYRFAYTLEAAAIVTLAEWIALERRCCPFLDFTLELPADAATIALRLEGRPGVKKFVEAEFVATR